MATDSGETKIKNTDQTTSKIQEPTLESLRLHDLSKTFERLKRSNLLHQGNRTEIYSGKDIVGQRECVFKIYKPSSIKYGIHEANGLWLLRNQNHVIKLLGFYEENIDSFLPGLFFFFSFFPFLWLLFSCFWYSFFCIIIL